MALIFILDSGRTMVRVVLLLHISSQIIGNSNICHSRMDPSGIPIQVKASHCRNREMLAKRYRDGSTLVEGQGGLHCY